VVVWYHVALLEGKFGFILLLVVSCLASRKMTIMKLCRERDQSEMVKGAAGSVKDSGPQPRFSVFSVIIV
jgi:hypothetical protein